MNEYIVDGQVYQVSDDKLEKFLKEFPNAKLKEETIEPVKTTPVEMDATAGEEIASDTVLPLEDGSLVSQEDKSLLDLANDYSTNEAENLNPILREGIQTGVGLLNVLSNLPKGIQSAIYDGAGAGLKFIEQVAGKDAADFLTGERAKGGAIAFVDPETNEKVLFKNNPEKWKELSKNEAKAVYNNNDKEVGQAANEEWIELVLKAQDIKSTRRETGEVIQGVKEGDFSQTVGGIFNAIGSVVETAVPAVLTRGLSLAPQIVAPIVNDFNIEKAKTLYPDSSVEDALRQLEYSEQVDLGTPLALGSLAAGLEYVGIKGVSSYIAKSAWNYKGIGTLMGVGNKEGLTEYFQFGIESISTGLAQGLSKLDATKKGLDSLTTQDAFESYLQGFIGGTSVSGGGAKIVRALRSDSNGINTVNSSINQLNKLNTDKKNTTDKTAKQLIDDEIQAVTKNLKTYLETNQKLASFLSEEQKNELTSLIDKKDKLYNQGVELRDKNQNGLLSNKEYGYATRSINKQAKEIDKSISEIKNSINLEQVEKDIETAKKVGEKLGFAPEVLNSKQFEARIEKLGFSEQEKNEALLSEGFITPKGEVLINKDRAVEVGAIGVASHELLHRIVQNDLSDPTRRAEVVNDFKKQLSKKELDIVQKRIDENYKFNEDGTKKSESEYNEEYLTAFSDALRSGEISYEKTLFEKLAEPILKIFRPKGFTNASFKDGKDVYNFLKEYQRELSKGKLTQRAEKLSEIEATGEVETKFSKSDSDAVQTIFEQKGKEGAFEIIEKFKPITNKLVQRRSEAPSFDRQLLTDEIETGKRGIIDLINEYDASKGVPLAAYINKYLPSRAIEASNRVLDTEFKLDVTEAKGVTDTTSKRKFKKKD